MKIGGNPAAKPLIETAKLSLPTKKNTPANSLGDLSILLYGREKIGKTSFSAQFAEALFLLFEPGGKDLSIYARMVKDWKEFLGYIELLEKNLDMFKTIIVDTADLCYKLCEEYMLKKLLIQHASDEDFGKGWSLMRDEFSRAIVRLLKTGRGVIFTSHAVEKEIKTRKGQKYDRVMPTMSKQAREILEPIVDVWAYMEYDEDGNRMLHLRGDAQIQAGHRLQNHFIGVDKVPMGKTAEEAYANFVDAFNNNITFPISGEVAAEEKTKKLVIRR